MFNVSDLNSIQANAGLNLGGIFSVTGFTNLVIPTMFGIGGIVLLFNIISSGFKLMTSQGEPKSIQGAQSKITNSIIGIILMISAYWLVKLIGMFLGIEVFNFLF